MEMCTTVYYKAISIEKYIAINGKSIHFAFSSIIQIQISIYWENARLI